jgi:hypothetical protein
VSKLSPIEAHLKNCETCQAAQKHITPIVRQMQEIYAGKKSPPIVPCDDCREDVSGKIFMVHDALWNKINGGQEPCILCILCAEKRLGRRFKVEDFQPSPPCNAPWVYAVERYGE